MEFVIYIIRIPSRVRTLSACTHPSRYLKFARTIVDRDKYNARCKTHKFNEFHLILVNASTLLLLIGLRLQYD